MCCQNVVSTLGPTNSVIILGLPEGCDVISGQRLKQSNRQIEYRSLVQQLIGLSI